MIESLRGIVSHVDEGYAVIDVHGIGYKVFCTRETLGALGKVGGETLIWTYLSVRENALDLYGFSDRETLSFFTLLLSVSGIGPKSALAILSVASVRALKSAIASGDPDYFKKTTGIGTKKAEKIILELRDKLDIAEGELGEHRESADAVDALEALGYSRREAESALKKLPKDITSAEAKIKEALKYLGR